MNRKDQTTGTITKVSKQWWLKFNTKSVRATPLDGAAFPHVIHAEYEVDGIVYSTKKWIPGGWPVPEMGSPVKIEYEQERPSKGKIIL